MLPSMQVPHQAGPSKGIATARRTSLPPDGLLCNYSLHLCHGQRLKGYEFCIKHILEDKAAPYRPCAYTVDTGHSSHQCPRAAPRSSRGEGYCREHSRAVVQSQETARARRIVRKRGGGAVAALQDSLEQYKKGRLEADTRLGQVVLAGDRTQPEPEEEELVRVADTWAGDDGDSDCESVDSEAEESLKHAGVFTGEEVMRTMRDKLIRLQKLYIEQFGRLGHLLRESRRLYLAQVREEREAGLVSMSAQQAASPGDQLAAAKLKALTHYHSPAGREALLAARLREKRAAASGGGGAGGRGSGGVASVSAAAPCQHHLTSTTKCGEGVVPMTKFCPRHILEQQGQVLFRPCGAVTDKDDGPCQVPVPAVFSHTHCVFHTKLQPEVSLARTRPTPKLEAETKEDEVVVSKFEPEDVNGADTDTDKDEVCNENDKNEHDDSKTDSNAEDVDVENETT